MCVSAGTKVSINLSLYHELEEFFMVEGQYSFSFVT